MEAAIRAENGVILACYYDPGAQTIPITSAAPFIGQYLDGGYWTGQKPQASGFGIALLSVIDLETAVEVYRGIMTEPDFSFDEIMPYIEAANSD
jgi:hypothetical protein